MIEAKPIRLPVPFVLVTGGKGGVGKSTLAANLAVALAQERRRILLVDLDLGLGDQEVLFGLSCGPTIEDFLEGEAELADCVREGPGGLAVLASANGSECLARHDPERRERLLHALAELAREFELVIGDSPAGIGPDVLVFAASADRVLVVTTPEVAALTDAYGLIKALDSYGARTGADVPTPELVVNRASDVEEGQAIARKLRSICVRFLSRAPRQAGWLPRSQVVARSALHQRPFALEGDRGLEALCLRQLTQPLVRQARPLANPA